MLIITSYTCGNDTVNVKMDPSFSKQLISLGITSPTLSILEKEDVFTMSIFLSLNEQHLHKLVPFMKIGQHAILLQFWKEHTMVIIIIIINKSK